MELSKKDFASAWMGNITQTEVITDFNKLKKIGYDGELKPLSCVGNKVVHYFTAIERIDVVTAKKITMYEVYLQRDTFRKRPSIQKILKYYGQEENSDDIKTWSRIAALYFSQPCIFKPIVAMMIYRMFKPTSILDMTMGWGGRLVGACALDIPKYTGIDFNTNLSQPYEELKALMNTHSTTQIDLYFEDATKFDYSQLHYDFVLTSPPYYNIEIYKCNTRMSKQEWDDNFYSPLIINSFRHLQVGGHYCLNIPHEVYERIALPLLGNEAMRIPFPKVKRTKEETYKEYIYVWRK